MAADETRLDIYVDGSSRRRRPSRLLFTGTDRALCGYDDGNLRLVPRRFSAKDGFRNGNYALLAYAGENISLEFLYRGPPLAAIADAFEQRARLTDTGSKQMSDLN